jgi:hypothetical protein
MLLARLVTGRYGLAAGEDYPHPAFTTPASRNWLARVTAIFLRKRTG